MMKPLSESIALPLDAVAATEHLWRVERDRREIANTITHALGLALSLAAATVLLLHAFASSDPWYVASCVIYVVTMVLVYGASTCSHLFEHPRTKSHFRALDQGFIYLFIAGTFTPFALTYLRTSGWLLLTSLIWALALNGCFLKIFWRHRLNAVSVVACIVLGWLTLPAALPLSGLVGSTGLYLMLLGGLLYTVGTLFLVYDNHAFWYHSIWHLFVVAASTSHYLAILLYVEPQGP